MCPPIRDRANSLAATSCGLRKCHSFLIPLGIPVKKTLLIRDFKPSKATLEKSDIETIVSEFRQFLEAAVDGEAKGQTIMVEIR
jgi:hypothetical protein